MTGKTFLAWEPITQGMKVALAGLSLIVPFCLVIYSGVKAFREIEAKSKIECCATMPTGFMDQNRYSAYYSFRKKNLCLEWLWPYLCYKDLIGDYSPRGDKK